MSFAALAAAFVVEHDSTVPLAQRTLFTEAAVTATDPSVIRAQIAALHARIYGELVAADSPEVEETYQLYAEAFGQTNDRARAWTVTLTFALFFVVAYLASGRTRSFAQK